MPESSDAEPTSGPAMPSGNEAVRAGGYKPMKPRPDAEEYTPSEALQKKKLPKKVDLRKFMTKVEDQGQTMSCVANAVAGAYEYGVKRVTGQSEDVSRLFVYYNARWRANDQDEDGGCYVQNAIEGLQRFGSCPEKAWPFKRPLILKKPNRTSYQEGTKGKVSDMRKVPVKLEAWKQALAEGSPIVFGCILFDSFDTCCEQGGVVPMPSPEDVGRSTHGGHSMLCVGYSDVEKVFIVRNSWGEAWGDNGYCYMPYNYLMNPKFNDGDCWIFTPPVELDAAHRPPPPDPHRPKPHPRRDPRDRRNVRPAPPLPAVASYVLPLLEEFWFYDDAPVVNSGLGVDFIIETYEISLYESIEINYFEEYTVEWSSVVVEEYAEYSEYVIEESFESMEEYSIQQVAQEYTRETGETNFSVGSAIATIGGVAAAAAIAGSVLNRGEDDEPAADDTALAEISDAGEEASGEDEDTTDEAEENDEASDEEEGDDKDEDAEEGDGEEEKGDDDSAESDDDEEGDDSGEEEGDDEEGDDSGEEEGDDAEEGDDEEEGDDGEEESDDSGEEEGGDEEESDDSGEEEGGDEEESDDSGEEEGGDEEESGGDEEGDNEEE